MLRRKMPEEIFDGRRVLPHDLFSRSDVTNYLDNLERALDIELGALPDSGELDVFAFTRRLGHRIGLASWGGPTGTEPAMFDVLCAAFDDLDGSESFVRPDLMTELIASDKAQERAALASIAEIIGEGAVGFSDEASHPLFARIVAAWSDEPTNVATTGVGRDVALLHIASMSNLFAALGWALIDLAETPCGTGVCRRRRHRPRGALRP